MGILTLYLQERKRQKDFEEQKRQFGEQQKLDKAQAEISKQTSERLLRDLMERVSSKKINISPTMTSPEGERTQHPFFQETGIAPDFSSAIFGEGEPQIRTDKGMFGDWYEGLQARQQGETEFEQKKEFKTFETSEDIRKAEELHRKGLSATGGGGTSEKKWEYLRRLKAMSYDDLTQGQLSDLQTAGFAFDPETETWEKGKGTTQVDYGKALDSAKFEYALRGLNSDDPLEVNRADLNNMTKAIMTGDMQITDEADVLQQIIEDIEERKSKEDTGFLGVKGIFAKDIPPDWEGISAKYPELDIEAVQKGFKALGY